MDPTSPVNVSLADGVTREFLLHHRLCPSEVLPGGVLRVLATSDARLEAIDDLALAYRCSVSVVEAGAAEVDQSIECLATRAERMIELEQAHSEDDLDADTRDLANQPPVIRYVNLLVREAYDAGASDIHLEASRSGLAARFRLDGVLTAAPECPAHLQHAVVSRVKLLAELDIAERRRPQDGRIRVRLESRELDLRVATVPTLFGESVVLRLLERGGRPVELGELGMPGPVLDTIRTLAGRPHGMILVTGPTGSGKTTTLYAVLRLRSATREKIITVEDPVEYQLPGVTQVPVHRHAGVTFGGALRSILRQDPDVVMIGEMRDGETAEIAVQAAMTGHLVFSTLHTNDAIGALPRLADLGIPSFLIASTVDGILAQRLVRRTCDGCRETYVPSDEVLRIPGLAEPSESGYSRGAGCAACRGTGYRGRVGIFEMIRINDELRAAITRRASGEELRAIATASGMQTMLADAARKVRLGLTTAEELLRVIQA